MKELLEQTKDENGKNQDKYVGYERVYIYMRVFYGLFICWLGFNILLNEQLNKTDQKYMKESLTLIKNMSNYFYPDFKYDYDGLISKTPDINATICYMLIIGGLLLSIGFKFGKYIIILTLIINILLVKNIFYLRGEKLRVNVFKFISFLGGAIYL